MHHRQAEEAKPVFIRLATLRARWDGISRTTLFNIQRKHPELASEYPFGPGLPFVRLSAVEAFEQRTRNPREGDSSKQAPTTAQVSSLAQAVSA
jgi:hypothetical protein